MRLLRVDAGSAEAPDNKYEICAFEFVSFRAVGAFCMLKKDVLAMAQWLKVRSANAWRVGTSMVKILSFRNRTYGKLVADNMCAPSSSVSSAEIAITKRHVRTRPYPAAPEASIALRVRTMLVNLFPETLGSRLGKYHIGATNLSTKARLIAHHFRS